MITTTINKKRSKNLVISHVTATSLDVHDKKTYDMADEGTTVYPTPTN
jgi:hypothetical protein